MNIIKMIVVSTSIFLLVSSNLHASDAQEQLHKAIVNNSPEQIKTAIEAGADINMGIGQQPPLLLAVLLDAYDAVKVLIANGANPNITYSGQPLALYLMLQKGTQQRMAPLLFNSNEIKLSQSDKDIAINYLSNNRGSIELLQKLGYDVQSNFNNADLTKNWWYLSLKPESGMNWLALVNAGANVNQEFIESDGSTWTPLLIAINNEMNRYNTQKGRWNGVNTGLIEGLLRKGANINKTANPKPVTTIFKKSEQSPLSYALIIADKVFVHMTRIVEFLINKGASVEQALSLAIKSGFPVNDQILFASSTNQPFKSFLYWAVENNQKKLVQELIEAGADVNQPSQPWYENPDKNLRTSHTPLKVALLKGYGDIIKILMDHGAHV